MLARGLSDKAYPQVQRWPNTQAGLWRNGQALRRGL